MPVDAELSGGYYCFVFTSSHLSYVEELEYGGMEGENIIKYNIICGKFWQLGFNLE